MKKIIFSLIFIAIALVFIYQVKQINKNPTTITSDVPNVNSERKEYVKSAGLTITVPSNFQFSKEEQMNLTTNKPYGVNFYIQNYKESISETKEPYQLYAIYQWDTQEVTEEEFKKADFMLDEATRKEFVIDGNPAISGTIKGERARFTTYILNNGHILTLAASETTLEQREITNKIIQSIKFDII